MHPYRIAILILFLGASVANSSNGNKSAHTRAVQRYTLTGAGVVFSGAVVFG